MAKNGEPWDDSALIKALDDAISKYKIMHGKEGTDGSLKEERITKGTEESSPIPFDGSYEAKSVYVETNDNNTDVLKDTTKMEEVMASMEKHPSEVVDHYASPSNGDGQVQDRNNTYINAAGVEDYNLLLNQYKAVDEQRQKLLEQLYQYGNWGYQDYGYDAAYGSQYHPVPAPQASGPTTLCSCRAYVCPYSTVPCTSLAVASSCKPCVGSSEFAHNRSAVSLEDGGFIEAAKGAVDRAIHSFYTETSGIPEVDKEKNKGEEVAEGSGNAARDKTSQTDLSVVLNAWFSAGFYTGKYLSEQASAKK